ncbi:Purine-cytosine permease FCY2 [Cyphellophora attinorum]|uniref:Purine-cytosine permease FCY2 n=1 Tax=Cyphellophora attinorum TaxID=1664694 RepID=A0A0N1HDE1_9EURO|nr:Purine-cytosine permease FCY2 [Phialophora attinorum]KPI42637.1 Purine-cytosine permease FCY2 [Phialophora attinorum]
MSSDEERGVDKTASHLNEKSVIDGSPHPDPYHRQSNVELYNGAVATQDNGILSKLRRFESRLDAKLGVEAEAIVRKLPHEKRPVPWHEQLTMALLWASGTMNTSCFATGFLGWEFGLTLRQSIVVTVFASLLGGAITGFAATFGAATGLRQISMSRYSFGWWPNKITAALNTIVQIGWAAVSCITGGLALTAVADGHVSLVVGIIILGVVAMLISFVGLKAILVYERYAWFIFFVVFLIFFGETGKYADNTSVASVTGSDLSASVLSLLAIIYGSSASWCTMASDYYVHYPADVSRVKVFLMTTFGIAIPTSIGMVAGCVVSSALNNRPDWKDAYENQGLGYLIQDMLYPRGFAKFILTLLVLSGINVNIISIYSSAISCQQFSRPFSRIPRFIWTLACSAVILGLALGGRDQLNAYLQNFLSILGYWSTQYFVIIFSEHWIFRKGKIENYDLDGWNDPSRLPVGLAAWQASFLESSLGSWETVNDSVVLPDDEPFVIAHVLDWIYMKSYTISKPLIPYTVVLPPAPASDATTQYLAKSLETADERFKHHINMYLAADKFGIPSLKAKAKRQGMRRLRKLKDFRDREPQPEILEKLFSSTLPEDSFRRAVVHEYLKDEILRTGKSKEATERHEPLAWRIGCDLMARLIASEASLEAACQSLAEGVC